MHPYIAAAHRREDRALARGRLNALLFFGGAVGLLALTGWLVPGLGIVFAGIAIGAGAFVGAYLACAALGFDIIERAVRESPNMRGQFLIGSSCGSEALGGTICEGSRTRRDGPRGYGVYTDDGKFWRSPE